MWMTSLCSWDSSPTRANVLAVTAVTLANGADNLAAYTPLFATRRLWEVGLLTTVFLFMTALMALGLYILVGSGGGCPVSSNVWTILA